MFASEARKKASGETLAVAVPAKNSAEYEEGLARSTV